MEAQVRPKFIVSCINKKLSIKCKQMQLTVKYLDVYKPIFIGVSINLWFCLYFCFWFIWVYLAHKVKTGEWKVNYNQFYKSWFLIFKIPYERIVHNYKVFFLQIFPINISQKFHQNRKNHAEKGWQYRFVATIYVWQCCWYFENSFKNWSML